MSGINQVFVTKTQTAERYRKTPRTVDRWRRGLGPVGFPKPLRVGGRWLWRLGDLERWERDLAATALKVAA
jgi:hypothetical protein